MPRTTSRETVPPRHRQLLRLICWAVVAGGLSWGLFSLVSAREKPEKATEVAPADPFYLALHGRVPELKALIAREPDVVRRMTDAGQTPLHIAVLSEDPEGVIELLVSKGAQIDAQGEFRRTPLQVAASVNPEAAKVLLRLGADPMLLTGRNLRFGENTLSIAAGGGHLELVKLLLKRNVPVRYGPASFERTALHDACTGFIQVQIGERYAKKANAEVIDLLVQHLGGDVNIHSGHYERRTPLQVAAANGQVEIVEHLLKTYPQIDLKATDMNGNTALHLAVHTLGHQVAPERRAAVVRLLLEYGANSNTKNYRGETPSAHARDVGDPTVLRAFAPPARPPVPPPKRQPGQPPRSDEAA